MVTELGPERAGSLRRSHSKGSHSVGLSFGQELLGDPGVGDRGGGRARGQPSSLSVD